MHCSRRSFIVIASILLTSRFTDLSARESRSDDDYVDNAAAEAWIKRWMDTPGAAAGMLHLGRFAERMYFLTQGIGWTPKPNQPARSVAVPAGFVTDFASIPRVFWSLLPPDGIYTYPAIIHDYLYWEQPMTRHEADLLFRYAMEDFAVEPAIARAIYKGVNVGGAPAWNKNARLKASGEKRILKVYPTDPTVRWTEWKQKAGVF